MGGKIRVREGKVQERRGKRTEEDRREKKVKETKGDRKRKGEGEREKKGGRWICKVEKKRDMREERGDLSNIPGVTCDL